MLLPATMLTERYETLRAYALVGNGVAGLRCGQGALMARGMVAWIHVASDLVPPVQSAPVLSDCEPTSVPAPVQQQLVRLMGEAVMTLMRRRYE